MNDPRSPLVRARGQITFVIGLVLAAVIILRVERAQFVPVADVVPMPQLLQPSAEDAGREWAYVVRNTDATTSLVSLEDGTGVTSVAGIGYAIRAALGAHRLHFISGEELHQRVGALIVAGSKIDVAHAGRVLLTRTAGVGEDAAAGGHGGYESALELVAWGYPSLRGAAITELHRWQTASPAVSSGDASVSALQRASRALMVAGALSMGERR